MSQADPTAKTSSSNGMKVTSEEAPRNNVKPSGKSYSERRKTRGKGKTQAEGAPSSTRRQTEDDSPQPGADTGNKGGPDEESLQMFLSTDNMEEDDDYLGGRGRVGGDRWAHHPGYSDKMQRKHESIIRRILAEFDMEETKSKYRNTSAYEHRPRGKSLADFRFRSELIRMMGSEVIRLNDQGWSQKFQQALRDDYEKRLDEQCNNLAEVERQRIHRLRIEGLLADEEVYSRRAGRTGHKKRSPKSQGHTVIFQSEECNDREKTLHDQRQGAIYKAPPDIQSYMERLNQQDSSQDPHGTTHLPPQEEEEQTEKGESEEQEKAKPAPEGPSQQDFAERRMRRYKHLPAEIVQLYEEETVTGLYTLARQLVGDAGPKGTKGKEVKLT